VTGVSSPFETSCSLSAAGNILDITIEVSPHVGWPPEEDLCLVTLFEVVLAVSRVSRTSAQGMHQDSRSSSGSLELSAAVKNKGKRRSGFLRGLAWHWWMLCKDGLDDRACQ